MTARGVYCGRIDDIPVYIDPTWFLFAPIMAIALGKLLNDFSLGLIGVALIYFANLGHEAAHASAARSAGGHIHKIIIFALGTLLHCDELADPRAARTVALAGPLYSLILGLALAGASIVGYAGFHSIDFPIVRMIVAVASVTLAFGFFFNLLPIWPMDGGRILRASLRLAGYSQLRTASLCLGLTLALCGAAIFWGALQFAVSGSFFWWPKMALATMLICNALATYHAEIRDASPQPP